MFNTSQKVNDKYTWDISNPNSFIYYDKENTNFLKLVIIASLLKMDLGYSLVLHLPLRIEEDVKVYTSNMNLYQTKDFNQSMDRFKSIMKTFERNLIKHNWFKDPLHFITFVEGKNEGYHFHLLLFKSTDKGRFYSLAQIQDALDKTIKKRELDDATFDLSPINPAQEILLLIYNSKQIKSDYHFHITGDNLTPSYFIFNMPIPEHRKFPEVVKGFSRKDKDKVYQDVLKEINKIQTLSAHSAQGKETLEKLKFDLRPETIDYKPKIIDISHKHNNNKIHIEKFPLPKVGRKLTLKDKIKALIKIPKLILRKVFCSFSKFWDIRT